MYASTEFKEWRRLWHEISKLVIQGIPSLVANDFNYIAGPHEKMGGKRAGQGIESREFGDFMVQHRFD